MTSRCRVPDVLSRLTMVMALVFLMGAASSSASAASATGGVTIWQVADGNQKFTVSGTVESVSYASNSVRINASGQNVEISLTPTTVIEYHGESGSIADIRRGSKISASGVVRNGQKVALSVVLK
jgi:hypothetical protein